MPDVSLKERLKRASRQGELYYPLAGGLVRCHACAHECRIPDGKAGVCGVRFNEGGRLLVPYGYVAGLQVDPIEKKPFYHVLPGGRAMSFGMLGCNLRCEYCQNWLSSQALREPAAEIVPRPFSPGEIAAMAVENAAAVLASTYNEPLITAEWAVDVFRAGRKAGLRGAFVSNGYATRRVLEYLRPWVDFYKVDLKGFDEKRYFEMTGGRLGQVLRSIEDLLSLGFWVEIVTLVVPGFNDSDAELRSIARFLASLSKDIPWHLTAFHPEYKLSDAAPTPARTLLRAAKAAKAEGLRYVYVGNLSGEAGDHENTFCHACGELLIERRGFRILGSRLPGGRCPKCRAAIPGVWT